MARPIEGDFLEHHFDRSVGFAGYALLFVSPFFFAIPGLVAVALAYSHRRGAGGMIASHYRFQVGIFWTCVVMFCLGCIAAFGAAALGLVELLRFLPAEWNGFIRGLGMTDTTGATVGWSLFAAAVVLVVGSWVWSMLASAFGFIKLVGSRPIGHDAYDDDD